MTQNAHFDGAEYDHIRDCERLTGQILDIYSLMKDGEWRTLDHIEKVTGHPQASISAQLRNLRKERFGGYVIERNHLGSGLYEYRLDITAQNCGQTRKIAQNQAQPENIGLKVFDDVFRRNPHLKSTFKINEIEAIRADLRKV